MLNYTLMTELFSQRVVVAENILMRELDGESVILDLSSENYFGLDEIGTRMWQILVSSGSIQDAYEILLQEYEVDPEQLQLDVQELVSQLIESGLMQFEKDQDA